MTRCALRVKENAASWYFVSGVGFASRPHRYGSRAKEDFPRERRPDCVIALAYEVVSRIHFAGGLVYQMK